MKCNICGCSEFIDMRSRKNVRCQNCRSLERTRLMWLYINKLNITKDFTILHLAPEKGLSEKLYNLVGNNYTSADINPENFKWARNFRKIDLTDLNELKSNCFDLIIHSHIMEHIPCNIAYTFFHLHRALKYDGRHICVIPFVDGWWDESFVNIGSKERIRRFGQNDHVRRFGKNDLNSSLGKIIRLPSEINLLNDFDKEELIEANIPDIYWNDFTITTVLNLSKKDYLLI